MTGRLLWFFMLQQYVPPAGDQPAAWVDTATRYVELKPRRDGKESDPVTAYCVRHMTARMRNGQPKYRVVVHEYLGRAFCSAFVVHIDGTRTAIGA
ncbi:hypothetical protein [Streptomyces sp. WAC 06738]|uniref:hypothetical protein n=1 Tax=Streptomyces sp. WAC 06738 TaxID=2203210 RepID=UPI0013E02F41|nr:hypothetical protein [Streptomyces sp. WAC 06738]